jgi:uncharacterized surface protein with fasciclin (FAS1) repeats
VQDKLPSPKGDIAITLLVPTNGAWLRLLWDSGFFIPSINKLGDVLPATVLYNTMFGAISPEQVSSFTEDNPGSAASIYGLLSGQNGYQIQYWASEKDQKTAYYFSSEDSLNDHVAETFNPVQVCNSWIYLTNKVLIPSATGKIKDVEKVTIPDNLPWENNSEPQNPIAPVESVAPVESPQVPSPVPSPPEEPECRIPDPSLLNGNFSNTPPSLPVAIVEEKEEISPSYCNTTLADEARKVGLGLLATALSQDSVASNMPKPSESNTLFAPTDSAFLSMLGDLGISITDALALGNKLTGVLLYHIHPGEALTTEQLKERASLSTTLGNRENDDRYSISVISDDSENISLGSLKPGDVANIVDQIQVCGTTVYVIDKVLLPATGVEDLPDPGAPVARRFQKELQKGVLDAGLAKVIGPLQFCTVILEAAGQTVSTETDANGAFYFKGIPRCAIDTGLVRISMNDSLTCADGFTKLPMAYDLYVDLNVLGKENSSFPTRDAPLLLSPASTILASPYIQVDNMNQKNNFNQEVALSLGFGSAEEMLFGSSSLQSVETPIGENMAAINSQSYVTTLLGGYVLQSFSNVSLEIGTASVDNVIASQLSNMVDLGDPMEVERVLEEAATLATDESLTIDSRILQSISKAIAEENKVLKQIAYSDALNPDSKQENIKATVIMAQNEIAPAIQSLAMGNISIDDFETAYGPGRIQQSILGGAPAPQPTGPQPQPQPQPSGPAQEVVQQVSGKADMLLLLPLLSIMSILQLFII